MTARIAVFTALALALPVAGHADKLGAPVADPIPLGAPAPAPVTSTPNLVFTLSGGVASAPEYFGSDDYTIAPAFGFSFDYVNLGPLNFGSPDPYYQSEGFGLRGSFRYIDERTVEDHPELAGTQDVDATLELGLGLGYESRNFDAFADVRYGFGGHEGFVGEIGADAKVQPTDRLTLSAGPRVLFGDGDYMSAYFDTSAAFAGGAYDADSGVVSAGVELGATYRINENWGIEGAVTYDRFVGDAADSPIVTQGDRDQYGVSLGVTRRITLDF